MITEIEIMVEQSPKSVITQNQHPKDLAMAKTERPGQTTFDRPDSDQPTDEASTKRFEWSSDEIRPVGYRVIDLIADYLITLPSKPTFQPFSPGTRSRVPSLNTSKNRAGLGVHPR
jgi:hypothetical protein